MLATVSGLGNWQALPAKMRLRGDGGGYPKKAWDHAARGVFRSAGRIFRLKGGSGTMIQAGGATVSMEKLVLSLTSSSNEERSEAEKQYNVVKKEAPDSACGALISMLGGGYADVEARSMAAVLARNDFLNMWDTVSPNMQDDIKRQLLVVLKVSNAIRAIEFRITLIPSIMLSPFHTCW